MHRRAVTAVAATAVVFVALFVSWLVIIPSTPPVVMRADAGTLNIPYTFSPGGIIYSSQMNANNTAIRSVVNSLDDANYSNAGMTGSTKLKDATVTLAKLASNSVDASKIVDGSIVLAELASSSVDSSKIVDGTIALGDMASNSVDSSKIVDGTIANGDIADNTIAEVKLAINSAPTDGYVLFWNNAAGKLDYKSPTGQCAPIGITTTSQTTGTKYFLPGSDGASGSGLSSDPQTFQLPIAMAISSLRVKSASIFSAGQTVTFTIEKNGADTALACTVATSGTSCTSGTGVAFSTGDSLSVKVAPSGSISAVQFSLTFCTAG